MIPMITVVIFTDFIAVTKNQAAPLWQNWKESLGETMGFFSKFSVKDNMFVPQLPSTPFHEIRQLVCPHITDPRRTEGC